MIRSLGILCLLLSVWTVAEPAALPAQQSGAWVLPGGMVRLRAGMHFTHFGSRFAPGGTEPLASPLLQPLTSETFAPVAALETELNRFLAETEGSAGEGPARAGPENLLLGTPDVAVSGDVRVVPFALEMGVLPRVQIGVEVPVHRAAVAVERLGSTGSTVGINPDPAANAAALAALGPQYQALGQALFLPTDSSALGRELQRRVQALGAAALELPAAIPDSLVAAGDSAFADLFNLLLQEEMQLAPLRSDLSEWQVGDATIGARVRLLGNLGELAFPEDSSGVRYRVTAVASVRLPTGAEAEVPGLFAFRPRVGLRGWGAGVLGDLFVGDRLWVEGGAQLSALGEVEVTRRLVPPEAPLATDVEPVRVRWSPGAELRARLAPRYRLTDDIALGAEYALLHRGGSTYRLASGADGDPTVLDEASGATQWLGASAHFSTLPAFFAGGGTLPVEVGIVYRAAFAGPDGALAKSTLSVEASLLHRLWGR